MFEEWLQFVCLQSGWSHQQFQRVLSALPGQKDLLQEAEQDLTIYGFLMDVVQHYHWVLRKERIRVQLLDHHSIGHENHPTVLLHCGVESHMIGNLIRVDSELLGDSFGNGECGDSSRHTNCDSFASNRVPSFNKVLGNLSCFSRTSFSSQDHNIMRIECVEQTPFGLFYWKVWIYHSAITLFYFTGFMNLFII